MANRTYDDILAKAEKTAAMQAGGECAILAERVLSLEEELDDDDLPVAVRKRIALQLRALVREMQVMHCPVPHPK